MSVTTYWARHHRDHTGRFVEPPAHDQAGATQDVVRVAQGIQPHATPASQAASIVYGILGHLTPAHRARFESYLAQGGLQRVTANLLAWAAAADLDSGVFRDRFLHGGGSDDLIAKLRKAADGVRATTGEQTGAASDALAAAYQLVGPDRWPTFIATTYLWAQDPDAYSQPIDGLGPAVAPAQVDC
jgi:hypothetical protein